MEVIMPPVKYRLYKKSRNTYVDLNNPHHKYFLNLQTEEVSRYYNYYADKWDEVSIDDYELEKWTGLKDRNGTYIFENDIVLYYPYGNKYKPQQDVFWNNLPVLRLLKKEREENELTEHYVVNFYCGSYRLNATSGCYGGILLHTMFEKHECEVVGNIHENPELLGGMYGR